MFSVSKEMEALGSLFFTYYDCSHLGPIWPHKMSQRIVPIIVQMKTYHIPDLISIVECSFSYFLRMVYDGGIKN
jgi:hypothetical protein